MRKFLICMLVCMLSAVPVMADTVEEITELVEETEDVEEITGNIVFPDTIQTYAVNEDEYNFNTAANYAMSGSVYSGTYNSTIVSLWNGLLGNNVGKDYVGYRASQYEYYIFFGNDFECSGSVFSGTGAYYYLNTYSNGYGYTVGSGSFSISVSDSYIYTNISDDYPTLETDRGLLYEQVQTVLLIALLGVFVLRWIFIAR